VNVASNQTAGPIHSAEDNSLQQISVSQPLQDIQSMIWNAEM
jgi:hypothetical protein